MNIVLIALDTQRADHLGCYGYAKRTSPFIDSVARRGVLFERCYAPNIPTHPSFTTMLSGKEAITHDIINIGGGVPVAAGVRLLPEVLREHGFATAAVDSMGRHFTRGFDEYHSYEWDRSRPTVLRKAETVNALALPQIERLLAQPKPFFLFLHYWDPHTPYLPPPPYDRLFYPKDRDPYDPNNGSMDKAWGWEPFKWYFHEWMPGVTDSEYVINLYDGETAYMDRHLRAVFKALEPVQNDTLVILTADHGEIMDEHDGFFDHHGLYEGNIHVPLIFYWPNTLPRGKRVPGLVQNLDLAPTLLDLAGIPNREGLEGLSLLPTIFGLRDGNYDTLFFSEATWQVKRAVRKGNWKLIKALEPDPHRGSMRELYDLAADPTEQRNLADAHPKQAAELEATLDAWVAKRVAEAGKPGDPAAIQGRCGFRIGKEIPGEVIGRGATPLHKRRRKSAADIPKPDELRAPNEADDAKGTKMHGYVKGKRE